MKLIKKIAAIMLSVMMVLGMASVVSAAEGAGATSATGNGTITINNAIPKQTYKIYRILELESFSGTDDTGNYAYKVVDRWNNFITTGEGKDYLKIKDGYVNWIGASDKVRIAEFAKKALAYAIENKIDCTAETAATTTVAFNNLPLGYYVVESSVGALCGLTTTNPTATIQEKNGVPSVEKKVQEDSKVGKTDDWGISNTADIGQTVNFQTTITAQPGAQNYVLHDKMEAGLTFGGTVTVTKNGENVDATNYTLKIATDSSANVTDGCTFEIVFTQSFCNTLKADEQIIVTYSATLNEKAAIAGEENKNTTKLTYGDSSETTPSTTTTKTFELPVFKYTTKDSKEKALAGAIFTLSKNTDGTTPINLVETSEENATVTTPSSGKFTIKGLDADTYYLTETKQPDGYNKLSAPITVVIAENGTITVGSETVDEVKVLNNTGTLLPTTGGNGTSLIYFLGAVLALVSGVVLITKQRMKNS